MPVPRDALAIRMAKMLLCQWFWLEEGRISAHDAEIGSPTFSHSDRHPPSETNHCESALLRMTVRNGSLNQGVYRSTNHVRGLRPAVHLYCRRARVLRTEGLPKQAQPLS